MSTFRFRLQKVLEFRKTQLNLEEAQYRRQIEALAAIDRKRDEIEASGADAERVVRAWNPVCGDDLAALGEFRTHVRNQELELVAPRAECVKQLDAQHHRLLEARRRLRLLERLEIRRRSEWQAARDKELEVLASECYLAGWSESEV
jgi:hypothetical protein